MLLWPVPAARLSDFGMLVCIYYLANEGVLFSLDRSSKADSVHLYLCLEC